MGIAGPPWPPPRNAQLCWSVVLAEWCYLRENEMQLLKLIQNPVLTYFLAGFVFWTVL
jgi:hypothetical protein